MKKLLLILFALVPLTGCASSGPGYASGGGPYFYGDCLYLENCYDGYYRNDYYYYGYPTVPAPLARERVQNLRRRNATRVVSRRDGGSSGSSSGGGSTTGAMDRSSSTASHSSHSTTVVAPRGNPAPAPAPAPAPVVSHAAASH
jgi:hypothetical protein